MGITTAEFVKSYVAEMSDSDVDLERLVTEPSGLTGVGMNEAIGHPDVGSLGIPLMADFMAPVGSIYSTRSSAPSTGNWQSASGWFRQWPRSSSSISSPWPNR